MDRRVVAGLAGLLLVGSASPSPAQTVGPGRDPSAQPAVGLAPLRSIGDTINDVSDASGSIPVASPAVPTSPVGSGPAAPLPRAPVLTAPVGLTPLEPIGRSIRADYRQRGVISMFRRTRPQAAPATRALPTTEATPPPVSPAPAVSSFSPPATPDLPPADHPASAGRPAPFAGQVPDQARLQADPAPASNPGAGRPAPLADELPTSARPQASAENRPPAARPRAQPAHDPAFRQAEVATAAVPIAIPADPPATSTAAPSMVELPPPPALGAVDPPPIGTDPLRGMAPPVVPEPARAPAPELPASPPVPAPAPELPPPPTDPAVTRTSDEQTAIRTKPPGKPKELNYVTLRAAAVGDEIITINELTTIVNERFREMVPAEQRQQMSKKEQNAVMNQLAANALQGLIDQSLIIQEAKREMKNPKAQTTFNDYCEKLWKEGELPQLLRKTASANVYELKIKLAEQGKSYDSMKEAFRKKTLSRDFLGAKIHHKITCDLVQQRAYYNAHLDDFVQPARMTWREIEVSVFKSPSRAEARKKAEEILARLLRDEDFDALAKSSSDGPTASKGGLYVDMQPGSYGIPVVNDALNQLPVGQVSPILEAPNSFHIIRVDSRREKGPLRFDEVQDKVRSRVLDQNFQEAVEVYLNKLRSKTLVRTMFDRTESDPALVRRKDASVQPVSDPAPTP